MEEIEKKNWYALVDFADNRQVLRSSVQQYIKRHPELFNGHIKNEGGRSKIYFDDDAMYHLDKKYKAPEKIEVVMDEKYIKELAEARKELAEERKISNDWLQKFNAISKQLTDAQKLLENKEQEKLLLEKQTDEELKALRKKQELQERQIEEQGKTIEEQARKETDLTEQINVANAKIEEKQTKLAEEEDRRKEEEEKRVQAEEEVNKLKAEIEAMKKIPLIGWIAKRRAKKSRSE